MDAAAVVAERFSRFARDEAPGRSDLYAEWATGVAKDARMTLLLADIPATHRQPPLVFGVTRMLGAPEGSYSQWAEWVHSHAPAVIAECTRRSLQTNEPLRCAALLPALSGVEGPLALLEIGASAGLCLYPDRYSYRYSSSRDDAYRDGAGQSLDPVDGVSRVVLESSLINGPALKMPEVVWRAGIDVTPLDAAASVDRRFLISLVWPGEKGRVERVEAAMDIVAADPPLLVAGDATEPGVLEALAARAPAGATLVVTTPGVLPHIGWERRERLLDAIAALGAVWVSIDPPALHQRWNPPIEPGAWRGFVLGRNGVPLAEVDPLGGFVEWRAGTGEQRR